VVVVGFIHLYLRRYAKNKHRTDTVARAMMSPFYAAMPPRHRHIMPGAASRRQLIHDMFIDKTACLRR